MPVPKEKAAPKADTLKIVACPVCKRLSAAVACPVCGCRLS